MVRLKRPLSGRFFSQRGALHSTMVRLKRRRVAIASGERPFTFHYGSIKTFPVFQMIVPLLHFTFHYGSIKTQGDMESMKRKIALHSTMVRLKHREKAALDFVDQALHSTMVRLKQSKRRKRK